MEKIVEVIIMVYHQQTLKRKREEGFISQTYCTMLLSACYFNDPPTSKLHMTKYFKILTTECNKYTQLTSLCLIIIIVCGLER